MLGGCGEKEPLCTVGGSLVLLQQATMENHTVPRKLKARTTMQFSDSILSIYPTETRALSQKKRLQPDVHCSIIYSRKTWKQAKCAMDEGRSSEIIYRDLYTYIKNSASSELYIQLYIIL